jgi:CheY-like chemotaxis protein
MNLNFIAGENMIKSMCMIDDNDIDIYQVKRLINKTGLVESFYSFPDGQDALEHFRNYKETQNKFDGIFPPSIILLDINMPKMGGLEFLEEFDKLPTEARASLVVALLTSSEQDRKKGLRYSAVRTYLTKPLSKVDLQALDNLLNEN